MSFAVIEPEGGFSEQVEALCVDRQAHFRDSLLSGKAIRPRRGKWTLGDLIFLSASLNVMCEALRECELDESRLFYAAFRSIRDRMKLQTLAGPAHRVRPVPGPAGKP